MARKLTKRGESVYLTTMLIFLSVSTDDQATIQSLDLLFAKERSRWRFPGAAREIRVTAVPDRSRLARSG
jgi:hypothetical protein